MTIQFNLLPDVKIEYIKTKRLKRVMMVVAFACAIVSAGLLIIIFSFTAIQKRHVANLSEDIKEMRAELEKTPELTKILSVQNQLKALPALYDGRPAVQRLPLFIDQTTPATARLEKLIVDFSTSKLEIGGTADKLEAVNAYVDTLKYTTYKVEGEEGDALSAFKDVVLTKFSRDEKAATFTITMNFDSVIFDQTRDVKLTVPNLVTTRVQVPSAELFNSTAGGQQ